MPAEAGCACTPETPVPLLCLECLNKRRRIRDRLNRRKARARRHGQPARSAGTATVPPDIVADLADTLPSIHEALAQATNPGRALSPLEQQLAYHLRHLHRTLQDVLQPAAEELVEIDRDTSQYQDDDNRKKPKFAIDE